MSGTHHHAHHFNSAEHEFETAKEGMWVFMVTEVLMIGAIFVGYLLFRGMYLETFHHAHQMLSVPMGALNTVILLASSLTMALSVSAAQRSEKGKTGLLLGLTLLCGLGFLVVKYFEYAHKIHEGTLPGGIYRDFVASGHASAAAKALFEKFPKAPLFFSFYFVMTGIHALHVVIGMSLITWIWWRNKKGEFNSAFYTPVELVGFYWHFVDMVWIYLFPLLYLVG